jgi:hypothetical protein
MGTMAEDLQHAPDALAEIEVVRVQVELARLDLGEIENVVDDRQQGARGLDRCQGFDQPNDWVGSRRFGWLSGRLSGPAPA